jgi:UDP-N-acetyl-D-glucosamine dehydrogenase
LDKLQARGAQLAYHDPYVPVIPPTREHPQWAGARSVELTEAVLGGFDCVVIVTAHRSVDYALILRSSRLIVDTRNSFGRLADGNKAVFKA